MISDRSTIYHTHSQKRKLAAVFWGQIEAIRGKNKARINLAWAPEMGRFLRCGVSRQNYAAQLLVPLLVFHEPKGHLSRSAAESPTENGEKLSSSRAEPGQSIKSAVA